MAHAEIVSRANYRMYSIKLHVYANVITSRAERNPYESSYEFVRAAHVKRNCLKGNTQAGERCLTVDGFSDGNFRRSEVLSDFLFQRHILVAAVVLDAKLRASYRSRNI